MNAPDRNNNYISPLVFVFCENVFEFRRFVKNMTQGERFNHRFLYSPKQIKGSLNPQVIHYGNYLRRGDYRALQELIDTLNPFRKDFQWL